MKKLGIYSVKTNEEAINLPIEIITIYVLKHCFSLPRLKNCATALVTIKMMLLVNTKPKQIIVMRESELSKHNHEM